jgi:hypothetical protein
VTNRTDVHVRLAALEFLLGHCLLCSSNQIRFKSQEKSFVTFRPGAS